METSKEIVDEVAIFIKESNYEIIRGPKFMDYSEEYYTIDFKGPDGFVIEVAHTPNMIL